MTDGFETANAAYLERLFDSWRKDPESVDAAWASHFEEMERSGPLSPSAAATMVADRHGAAGDGAYTQSRVNSLMWGYRDVGYLYARLNPLVSTWSPNHSYLAQQAKDTYEQLSLEEFGLSEADLDREFSGSRQTGRSTLRDIVGRLRETYCGTMGVEFLHIQSKSIRSWLIGKMEPTRNRPNLTDVQRRGILEDVLTAEEFEHFLHTTFVGQKRFSLEGSEAVIPALHFLVDSARENGIEEIVLGMSHRGRLTVLNTILGKSPEEIFAEFEDVPSAGQYGGSGDVKYHVGYHTDHVNPDGSRVHVTLAPNSSHLESVDGIVEGKARATQRRRGDTERRKVVPVLIHGDAAFSGQGVVAEVLNLSALAGYTTGGTIHIVINNQIGFTTSSRDARSTFFPTDIVKALPVPIFHVNGDDPEAVVHAVALALQFRQTFRTDAVVDIFCYRRHGHNEGDEPSFTHPRMYNLIQSHPGVATIYGDRCDELGVMGKDERLAFRAKMREGLKSALEKARSRPSPTVRDGYNDWDWKGIGRKWSGVRVDTGVEEGTLRRIVDAISTVPTGFAIHPKLARIIQDRLKRFRGDGTLDWAFAEALAFGSLLLEGTGIRLSGQDTARGTFSQRHSVWWDAESPSPKPYVPLNNLDPSQAHFSPNDSPLSEYSVLAFEFGYSMAQPKMLVIWEAQFGDFANGAQVIMDSYIAASEKKWDRASGLVLLLPHAYEGQGPDHSDARLERCLQLCAEENLQVCNATTPAQYFHLLRRQIRRDFRRPLFIMAPKSLLRHQRAVSRLEDLSHGSFSEVLDEEGPSAADKLILCSGKVYYDLAARREKTKASGVAIVRIEQLYPFPREAIEGILQRHKGVRETLWVQEEPENKGAWTFIQGMFGRHFSGSCLRFVGRPASGSSATGSHTEHEREQNELLAAALGESRGKGKS